MKNLPKTDAVIIVVSEETGSISLVLRGRIERNLTEEQLRALERAREEKEAHGEIETLHPGYLGTQDTY